MDNSGPPTENNSKSTFESSSSKENKAGADFIMQPPAITLPKGGGALKNIDEKFNVNAANGTASFSVPLPFSKTRSNFVTAISLNYNSGSGNSEFGLGWNLDFSSIQRKTDKKLPLYKDADESDVFMFTGVEDLVPSLKKDGTGKWLFDEFTDATTGYTIKRYRPRIEGSFIRIEKITPKDTNTFYWKVTDKNNVVTIYGRSASAQLLILQTRDKFSNGCPNLVMMIKAIVLSLNMYRKILQMFLIYCLKQTG